MSNKVKIQPGSIEDAAVEVADAGAMNEMEATTTTAVATRPANTVGVFDLGADSSPLQLARIHIAHNLSQYEPEGAPKGSLWLGKDWDVKLTDLNKPVRICIIGISHYWKERPETYTPGQIMRTFRTEAEAKAAGLVTQWGPRGSEIRPNCNATYDLQILIEKPEGVESVLFCCELDGKEYAPAIVTLDKKSYTPAKQVLGLAALRDTQKRHVPINQANLTNMFFDMKTITWQTGKGTKVPYVVLSLALDETGRFVVPSDAFKDGLKNLIAGPAVVDDGEESPF